MAPKITRASAVPAGVVTPQAIPLKRGGQPCLCAKMANPIAGISSRPGTCSHHGALPAINLDYQFEHGPGALEPALAGARLCVSAASVFGQAAVLALLAAFYPAAMLVATLYLGSDRPGRTTALYVAGGLLIVTVVGIAVLLAIRAGGLSLVGHRQARYGLRLGLGVAAVVASIVLHRREPKPPDPAGPGRQNLIERFAARPRLLAAFAAGVVMFGHSLTFIAAVQVVATARISLVDTVAAMAMIVVLTVAFAWLPLVAYLIAPAPTIRTLRTFGGWLKRHGWTFLVAAIATVGVILIIQGATGLA